MGAVIKEAQDLIKWIYDPATAYSAYLQSAEMSITYDENERVVVTIKWRITAAEEG